MFMSVSRFGEIRVILLAFIFAVPFVAVNAQTGSGLKKVTVYFWEFNREGGGDDLIPFTRYVDKKAPLRPAIEALIAGPTEKEAAGRYEGVAYGDLKLESVKIKNGTARIEFSRVVGDINPGDLLTLRFETAVIRTAKQFPEIKKVIVCMNGIVEFGMGLVDNVPRPCPRNR